MMKYLQGKVLIRSVTPQKKLIKLKLRTNSGPPCPVDLPNVGSHYGNPVEENTILTIFGADVGDSLPASAFDIANGKTPPGTYNRFRAKLKEVKWTLAAITEEEGQEPKKVYQCDIDAEAAWSEFKNEDDEWTTDRDWLVDCLFERVHVDCAIFAENVQIELDLEAGSEGSNAAAM